MTSAAVSDDAALAAWLRDAIRSGPGRTLGSGYQASVELYSGPAGDVVVKKPHAGRLLGFLWLRLLRREHAVYLRLAQVPGVPRCYGLIDGRYLALEYIPGPSLREHESKIEDKQRFFGALLETLRAMHAAGVAHGDLKRKDNIIVGADGRPYIVDFGVARVRRGSPLLDRLLFEQVQQMDYNAWIKLKYRRQVAQISAADARYYRPLWIERAARAVRIPWQKITLRRPRQRWRRAQREKREKPRSDS